MRILAPPYGVNFGIRASCFGFPLVLRHQFDRLGYFTLGFRLEIP